MLLDKQDLLQCLEEELKDLDKRLSEEDEIYTTTRTKIFDRALREERADLMTKIEQAYCSYCE